MLTVQSCVSLLNTSSLTEVRYRELYVTDQCCLIALINRIIFWFLGGMGCCLGEAVGPTTIQDEQEAIRNYSQAKEALRTNETDAVNAFATAYLIRKQQLQPKMDPQLLDSALEADLQETGVDKSLRSQVKQQIGIATIPPPSACQTHYEKVTGELMSAFASAGQKVDAFTAKIDEYVAALKDYATAEGKGISFIHQHMNVDLRRAVMSHEKSIAAIQDSDYQKWCELGVCLQNYRALKGTIAEKLPLLEETGEQDAQFMSFFSADLEADFEKYAKMFKFSSLFFGEPFTQLASIPEIFDTFYGKLYLAMKARLEAVRGPSELDNDVEGFKVKVLREVLKRIWQKHGRDYITWINADEDNRKVHGHFTWTWTEESPKRIEELGRILPLLQKDVALLSEDESTAIDGLIAEILKSRG